jgi:hypothetical protein
MKKPFTTRQITHWVTGALAVCGLLAQGDNGPWLCPLDEDRLEPLHSFMMEIDPLIAEIPGGSESATWKKALEKLKTRASELHASWVKLEKEVLTPAPTSPSQELNDLSSRMAELLADLTIVTASLSQGNDTHPPLKESARDVARQLARLTVVTFSNEKTKKLMEYAKTTFDLQTNIREFSERFKAVLSEERALAETRFLDRTCRWLKVEAARCKGSQPDGMAEQHEAEASEVYRVLAARVKEASLRLVKATKSERASGGPFFKDDFFRDYVGPAYLYCGILTAVDRYPKKTPAIPSFIDKTKPLIPNWANPRVQAGTLCSAFLCSEKRASFVGLSTAQESSTGAPPITSGACRFLLDYSKMRTDYQNGMHSAVSKPEWKDSHSPAPAFCPDHSAFNRHNPSRPNAQRHTPAHQK